MAARASRAIAALAVLLLTLTAQARLPARLEADDAAPLLPRPDGARLGALGFESLLADYYWLRAVQVVGGERSDPGRHAPLLARLTELVVGLDPWVDHPYRFAALWTSGRAETRASANRMLERGIAYHPRDWRNRFYLSFNHFFEAGDFEAAARELEPAVSLPGAPRYLGRLLARLRSQTDSLEAAAVYLYELVRTAPDEQHRKEYEKALVEIETERLARRLDDAREIYRQRHGRDIERVEDLVAGPHPVLPALPFEPHAHGWMLHPVTGEIVSGYYQRRYQLYFQHEMAAGPKHAEAEVR